GIGHSRRERCLPFPDSNPHSLYKQTKKAGPVSNPASTHPEQNQRLRRGPPGRLLASCSAFLSRRFVLLLQQLVEYFFFLIQKEPENLKASCLFKITGMNGTF